MAMIFKVKTDNSGTTLSTQFRIPVASGSTYDYTVERCDALGNVLETLLNQTGTVTLTWSVAGTYLVKISGTFPRVYFNNSSDCLKLIGVTWDESMVFTSMAGAFFGCQSLIEMSGTPNLSQVQSFFQCFRSAVAFNQDISSWDVSSAGNLQDMFRIAASFNQDISSWDVSNVTNMSYMFYAAIAFNQDISSWDVSSVTNMTYMFNNDKRFNQDLSSWDVSNVSNMTYMFYNAEDFNQDLSLWCVSKIPSEPFNFSNQAVWVLPKPVWGTCPVLPTKTHSLLFTGGMLIFGSDSITKGIRLDSQSKDTINL